MCMNQLDYLDTITAAQRDTLPPEAFAAAEAETEAEEEAAEELPLVEVASEGEGEDENAPLDGQLALEDAVSEEPVQLQGDAIPADDATQMFHITGN